MISDSTNHGQLPRHTISMSRILIAFSGIMRRTAVPSALGLFFMDVINDFLGKELMETIFYFTNISTSDMASVPIEIQNVGVKAVLPITVLLRLNLSLGSTYITSFCCI